MANDLRIDIVVNGSQVQAGMDNAASSVQAGAAQIVAALNPTTASAVALAKQLMATGQTAQQAAAQMQTLGIATTTVNAAFQAINAAATPAAAATTQVATAAANTTAQMTSMERAMALATGRIAGMASGAGMLGGALGRVAAASSTLGPILSAAFPVIAIAALIQIVEMAHDKIIEVTSAFAGWGKEAQQMHELLIGLNQQTVAFNANLAIEKIRLGEIGLKGVALDLQKEKDLKTELSIRTDELTESLRREAAIRSQIQGQERTITVGSKFRNTDTTMKVVDEPDKDEVTRLNKELEEAVRNSQRLSEEIRKLKEVTIPGEQKKTAKDYNAELERSAEFNEKLIADTKRLAEEDLKALDARKRLENEAEQHLNRNDSSDQDFRDMRLREEAEEEFNQARITDAKNSAVAQIEIEQQKVAELARLGKISSTQEAAQLNQLEAEKLQIELAYLQKRIDEVVNRMADDDAESYKRDMAEWSKLLSDKQKAEEQYMKNREKNVNNSATIEQKTWTQLMQRINSAFDQSIQGLMKGTLTFRHAFANLLDSLLADFVSFLAKKVEKWAEEQLLELALHSTFLARLLGQEAAGNAAKTAEGASASALQVTQQAGVAGAAGFASVMASVPFPANVALAPEVMTAAIAATLGNLGLASAAGGWDVPSTIPSSGALSLIHPNEMVLPRDLADKVRGGGGAGADGVTISLTYNISAIDAKGVEDVLTRHSPHIAKQMQRQLRRSNKF